MQKEDKYKMLRLSSQLCFPLYACAKEIVKKYKPFLDELDLTYTQYITMMVMWENEKVNVKELGELLYLDSGTLTHVTLTDSGRELKDKALDVPKKMGACLRLTEEEMSVLHAILDKMLKEF